MNQLNQWVQQQTQLPEFDIAGVIGIELHTDASLLDQVFQNHDFSRSFQRPQVILAVEAWTVNMLRYLHRYLRHRPNQISNYYLIVIGHPGIADWWQRFQDLAIDTSFNIVEVLDLPFTLQDLLPYAHQDITNKIWSRDQWYADITDRDDYTDQDIHYYFLYQAGTKSQSFDPGYAKEYLLLQMTAFQPQARVDRCYALSSHDAIVNWVDLATFWQDQQHVDTVSKLYHVANSAQCHTANINTLMPDSAKCYENSFATVVRETVMTMPYGCVSEKTLRAFRFAQFVIPTTLRGVESLESAGFKFDHDLFDYSYQYQTDFVQRVRQLTQSLTQLINNNSLQDLRRHLHQRRDLYQHNQQQARKLTHLLSE